VAYSGGVDSALVLAVAHEALGGRVLACLGVSPSLPEREKRDAVALAGRLRAPIRLVPTNEHLDPAYAENSPERCFHCKRNLYDRLEEILRAEGWGAILDGTHADDLGDDRPGRRAAQAHGVRSPLLQAGMGKRDIRALARHLGLEVWDKPAMACLASRVPHGTAVSPELLGRIERAEDALARLGFRQFRVRHHGEIARIELPIGDLPRAVEHRGEIVDAVRACGWRFVCLDLAGFRSGADDQGFRPMSVPGVLPAP